MKIDLTLGLDVSTSTVGYSVLDSNAKLHDAGYINLKKIKGLVPKAVALAEELEQYKNLITNVAIEEPLVMYKEGFSRAQILSLLSQFNGMVQFLTFSLYKVDPVLYNVNTARKLSFPDMRFPKGCNRKEVVRERVKLEYPDIDWLYKPKAVKPDGSPIMKDEMYDMADSIVAALAHVKYLNNKNITL